MFTLNSKLTMTCSAAVLALAMAACSSSSDDNPPMAMGDPPPPVVDPEPDPVLTELEMAQAAAAAAATAAMTASGEAETAAMAAMAAVANLATMQTNATAGALAYEAHTAAGKAMAAYEHAKAASEAAAEAVVVTAAVEARIMAEEAMADAVMYAMMASEKGTAAETAAMAELMIDGTMKSVGETSIDAMAGASSVSTGAGADAQTVITGLIKSMNPMATGGAIEGNAYTPAAVDDLETAEDERELTDAVAKTMPYKQAAAERTFAIGKTLDSSDDMARLMLVTDYAGVNTVKVYADADTTGDFTGLVNKDGSIQLNSGTDDVTDDHRVTLRSVGMYFEATLVAGDGVADALDHTDEIGDSAEGVEVFLATGPGPIATNPDDDVSQHVVLGTTSKTGDATTVTYLAVDITAEAAAPDGPDVGLIADAAQVTVGIPGPVAYQHLHFGAWASLGEAAEDGAQMVTDLGIGFVQSIGDGMTGADMPSTGSATYNGDWVATVQAAAGGVGLENGAAKLAANFDKATVKATLDDLATLEGSIDGSMFSGTKATVGVNAHGLTSGGKFSGSFDGGFYGTKAAEAGAIFDFDSTNGGAFRGAFGGNKQP